MYKSNGSSQPAVPLGNTSLLLSCASNGDVAGINNLLDDGVSVNSCDYDKRTGLHVAASEGQIAVVELLLSRGADVNPVDRWGDTPLANAREYARGPVSKILEQHDGRVQDKRKLGLVADVEPSLHYEIDRSELVPVDGFPVFSKTATQELRLVDWRGTKVVARTLYLTNAEDPDTLLNLKRQLIVLEHMRHPNIVQYLCSVTKTSPPIIITEYLPRGDLHELLSKGPISPKRAVGFALDISRGMNYLHESREAIVHANLEPKNLLLNEAGQLKITDFGTLRRSLHVASPEGNEIGAYLYMAPEVYRNEPLDKSVDVFSFGLILHEMFEGLQSSAGATPEGIAKKRAQEDVRPGFFSKNYPRGMKELIEACWQKDPSKRPSFAELLRELENMDVGRTIRTPKRLCNCIPL